MSAEGGPDFYAEDEIHRYSEEFYLEERELETDFTSDAKSGQRVCDEQFPVLRPREQNEALIEDYLQYQPKELIDYVKQFDFQYNSKFCLSQIPIASHRKYSKTIPNYVSVNFLSFCLFILYSCHRSINGVH